MEVARIRRKLGGGGIILEGASRMEWMERIGNRHGGDFVMASHTIAMINLQTGQALPWP